MEKGKNAANEIMDGLKHDDLTLEELKELESKADLFKKTSDETLEKAEKQAEKDKEKLLKRICSDLEEMLQYSNLLATDIPVDTREGRYVYGFRKGKENGKYESVCVDAEDAFADDGGFLSFYNVEIYVGCGIFEDGNSHHHGLMQLLLNWDDTLESLKCGTETLMRNRIKKKTDESLRKMQDADALLKKYS